MSSIEPKTEQKNEKEEKNERSVKINQKEYREMLNYMRRIKCKNQGKIKKRSNQMSAADSRLERRVMLCDTKKCNDERTFHERRINARCHRRPNG